VPLSHLQAFTICAFSLVFFLFQVPSFLKKNCSAKPFYEEKIDSFKIFSVFSFYHARIPEACCDKVTLSIFP